MAFHNISQDVEIFNDMFGKINKNLAEIETLKVNKDIAGIL